MRSCHFVLDFNSAGSCGSCWWSGAPAVAKFAAIICGHLGFAFPFGGNIYPSEVFMAPVFYSEQSAWCFRVSRRLNLDYIRA